MKKFEFHVFFVYSNKIWEEKYLSYMINNWKHYNIELTNLTIKSENNHAKFETVAIQGFKRTFPSAIIKGCHFHFSKAIYQHAVSLGFKVYYSQNVK